MEEEKNSREKNNEELLVAEQQQHDNPVGKKKRRKKQDENEDEKPAKTKRYFAKEIKQMLYAFGDTQQSYRETVDLIEEIVMEYIRNTILSAMKYNLSGKLTLESMLFVIRNDSKKLGRVEELLKMWDEVNTMKSSLKETDLRDDPT